MKHFSIKILSLILLLFWEVGSLYAQSEFDAYNTSKREILGTARYRSMSGAFAALGGDLSSIERNPAGAAVYHSSDINVTFQLNQNNNKISWQQYQAEATKFTTNLSQIGFVASYYRPSTGNGFNFGCNYNQIYRVNRSFRVNMSTPTKYSLADFVAYTTPDTKTNDDMTYRDDFDPYAVGGPWFSILGFNSGWIVPVNDNKRGPYQSVFAYPQDNGKYYIYGPSSSYLQMQERGDISETDMFFTYNYKDHLYFGASLKLGSIFYSLQTHYGEDFIKGDYLNLENNLQTNGYGIGGSFGLIYRPMDMLRFALAFHTPIYYYLVDTYNAFGSSRYSQGKDEHGNFYPEDQWVYSGSTPEGAFSAYQIKTPPRVVLGVAAVISKYGLLSVDYELSPYGSMSIKDRKNNPYSLDNEAINQHFGVKHTIRIGAEYKPINVMALRVGFMHSSSPMKEGSGLNDFTGNSKTEVLVAGTLPHYIVPGAYNAISCGIGYWLSKSWYIDAAFVYGNEKQHLYAFPSLKNGDGELIAHAPEATTIIKRNYSAAITLGARF